MRAAVVAASLNHVGRTDMGNRNKPDKEKKKPKQPKKPAPALE